MKKIVLALVMLSLVGCGSQSNPVRIHQHDMDYDYLQKECRSFGEPKECWAYAKWEDGPNGRDCDVYMAYEEFYGIHSLYLMLVGHEYTNYCKEGTFQPEASGIALTWDNMPEDIKQYYESEDGVLFGVFHRPTSTFMELVVTPQ